MRLLALAVLAAACSGAAPPATAPEPAPAESPPAAPDPAPATEATPAPPAEPEPAAAAEAAPPTPAEPAPSEAARTRRPSEILVGANVAFLVDYAASQLHETAERSCDAEAGDDAAARAACMQKARATFRADVLELKKDAQGRIWLTVYERKGSALPELYKARVEFADETANAVTLRLKEEKGTRPFFAGARQIVVSVPTDYGLELNDPKLGRLPYQAKVGLLGAR